MCPAFARFIWRICRRRPGPHDNMQDMQRIAGIAAPHRRRLLMPCTRFVPLALAFLLAGPALAQSPQPDAAKPPAASAVPGSPAPLQPGDAFGEAVTLAPKTILFLKGETTWDAAFDTLVDSFKALNVQLTKA